MSAAVENPDITKYHYQSLESSKHIRLLKLTKCEGDEVACEIEHADLDDANALNYVALSYVCGDCSVLYPITVNDSQLLVAENLLTALKTLWLNLGQNQALWIDAICIDQNNVLERNAQVLLMGRIYQAASEVIVHLGPETEVTDKFPWVYSAVSNALDRLADDAGGWFNLIPFSLNEYAEHGLPSHTNKAWDILSDFYMLPWFSRCWTLQEAVLNESVRLTCAGWTTPIDLYDVVQLFLYVPKLELPLLMMDGTSWRLYSIWQWRINQEFRNQRLIRLAHHSRNNRASDPRDNLFALVGLSQERDIPELAPNYDEELEVTLKRYAKYFVNNNDGINVLTECFADELCPGLPSWVPRWHSTQAWAADYDRCIHLEKDRDLSTMSLVDGDTVLHAKGLIFDTVSAVCPSVDDDLREVSGNLPDAMLHYRMVAYLVEINSLFADQKARYVNDELLSIAAWRTLSHGDIRKVKWSNEADIIAEYGGYLKAYLDQSRRIMRDRDEDTDDQKNSPPDGQGEHEDTARRGLHMLDSHIASLLEGASDDDDQLAVFDEHGSATAERQPWPWEQDETFNLADSAPAMYLKFKPLMSTIDRNSVRRRRFITAKGYLGQALPTLRVGDVVVFFNGGDEVYILQPLHQNPLRNEYKLIGKAFLYAADEAVSKSDMVVKTDAGMVVQGTDDIFIV